MPSAADPVAVLRSRSYHVLLGLAAVIGVPISAVAWGFLALVSKLQGWLFTSLPSGLGFHGEPIWWPLPLLGVSGLLVGLTIRYLPGTGGHSPADGLQPSMPTVAELPGVFLAAVATLALGAVLGPEAPLIALGAGLAAAVVRLSRHPVPPRQRLLLPGRAASPRSARCSARRLSARSCSWRWSGSAARRSNSCSCRACWRRASVR